MVQDFTPPARGRRVPPLVGGFVLLALLAGPAWADATAVRAHRSAVHGRRAMVAPHPRGKNMAKPQAGVATPPKAGALPFVPPILARLPGGGSFTLDTKGITLKSEDEVVTFRIGGRLHLDGSAADLRPAAIGPALSDDFMVRRAWLESVLTIDKVFEAGFQYDFSKTTMPINDAVLSYRGFQPVILTIGNFKEPFSLDQLTSNNNTLFVERSLLDAFAPARDFGAALGTHGDRWTLVGGVYGGNANLGVADDGIAGTVRATYAPILKADEVLHVGIAGSYRSLDPAATPLSFSSTPEDNLFSTSLVDTGTLRKASDVGRLGLEALYQNGPYRIKAEYALTEVGGANGQSDRTFQAGYVEAAWVINGRGRPYDLVPDYGSTYAILGGVKVDAGQRLSNGGAGIFELGARYSAISLQQGLTPGGVQQDFTGGVNWYPDNNIKVMADYVRAHADPSAASVTGGPADSDIFVGRVQFYW